MPSLAELYTKTTRNIEISVTPSYLPEQSEPENSIYSYSYEVTISNTGKDTVQLINRHWKIISGGVQVADVKGEGVVGEQPTLEPGQGFSYTSWTTTVDPIGSMYGAYTFYSDQGEFFDVEVPEFQLIYLDPNNVH